MEAYSWLTLNEPSPAVSTRVSSRLVSSLLFSMAVTNANLTLYNGHVGVDSRSWMPHLRYVCS